MQSPSKDDLARDLRAWREAAALTTKGAALRLGIPHRTIEGIEAGRGFRYPRLLRIAIGKPDAE